MSSIALPLLPSRPGCRKCELHESARSVGVPTVWLATSLRPSPDTPCVVVIGQNPGHDEDIANEPFVGPSGQLLRETYLEGINLSSRASVYLANALKCGPESINTAKHFNACWLWLSEDIDRIASTHSDITPVLLFVSAPAIRAFYKHTLDESVDQKSSFGMQGRAVQTEHKYDVTCMGDSVPVIMSQTHTVYVFSTYHPAAVMRRGSLILAVNDHLALLSAHLSGTATPITAARITPPRPPEKSS